MSGVNLPGTFQSRVEGLRTTEGGRRLPTPRRGEEDAPSPERAIRATAARALRKPPRSGFDPDSEELAKLLKKYPKAEIITRPEPNGMHTMMMTPQVDFRNSSLAAAAKKLRSAERIKLPPTAPREGAAPAEAPSAEERSFC